MKPKTVILTLVALSCGLAASFMTSQYLKGQKPPEPEETVIVLVAKADVPKYTVLSDPEKFFLKKEMAKKSAPGSFCSEFSEIKDKRVNKEFKLDVHISAEDISDKFSDLPTPKGMRGYAVPTNALMGVSGFIKPGDQVDVQWTDRENKKTKVILHDVQVLSVGDQVTKRIDQATPTIQASTLNLAVTPRDASKLSLAQKFGDLALLLRTEGEVTTKKAQQEDGSKSEVTLDDLRKGDDDAFKGELKPETKVAVKDPNKLPFGLDLKELEARRKAQEPEEPKPEEAHKVSLERGGAAPTVIRFWKTPAGDVVREDALPKPEAKPETKPETK